MSSSDPKGPKNGEPVLDESSAAPRTLVEEQTKPIPNDEPAIWDLVIDDMHARDHEGRRRYGTPLQPFNGRDPLVDAYQEALDLVVYLRQEIFERDRRWVRFQFDDEVFGFVEHLGGGHYRVLEPSPMIDLPPNTILYKEGAPEQGIAYAVVYRPGITEGGS